MTSPEMPAGDDVIMISRFFYTASAFNSLKDLQPLCLKEVNKTALTAKVQSFFRVCVFLILKFPSLICFVCIQSNTVKSKSRRIICN